MRKILLPFTEFCGYGINHQTAYYCTSKQRQSSRKDLLFIRWGRAETRRQAKRCENVGV